MSLTVKHLNSDASFLLSFRPILNVLPTSEHSSRAYTILLDPWIVGSSKIWHSKFSISRQKEPACIKSLQELPEPDLVIISQDKSDHCHKETLTQLARGGKTVILAEAAAAKIIRGWKHFDASKVVTLQKFEDPRQSKSSGLYRLSVQGLGLNGPPGEITIAFIPQKNDITGLHNAIGITYHPPRSIASGPTAELTPPDTPSSIQSTFSRVDIDRPLSVIFSPHGVSYKTLLPYITSYLVQEAALPLTALLHCFDRVQNSWYMGGNICSGLPGGQDIAQNLIANVWISAHDGDKITTGFANTNIVVQKYPKGDVENVVSPRSAQFPDRKVGTRVVVLEVGEEITLNRLMTPGSYDTEDRREREPTKLEATDLEVALEAVTLQPPPSKIASPKAAPPKVPASPTSEVAAPTAPSQTPTS